MKKYCGRCRLLTEYNVTYRSGFTGVCHVRVRAGNGRSRRTWSSLLCVATVCVTSNKNKDDEDDDGTAQNRRQRQ